MLINNQRYISSVNFGDPNTDFTIKETSRAHFSATFGSQQFEEYYLFKDDKAQTIGAEPARPDQDITSLVKDFSLPKFALSNEIFIERSLD